MVSKDPNLPKIQRFAVYPILVVASLVILAATFAEDGETERKYFFSPDPGVELIRLKSYDRYAQTQIVHTLFADGRFSYREISDDPSKPVESYERTIPIEDVDALVADIVDSGLIESDFSELGKRYPYASTSGGTFDFSLNLESYRGPGQAKATPLSKTGLFPMVLLKVAETTQVTEDVAALTRLVRRFRAIAEELS